jgi:ubiquinone biosynthesis protein UbiJ
MENDAHEILLQLFETLQEQQMMVCKLGRNDLLLIEAIRAPVSQEALAAVAETVRSTLHSVDALTNRIHALAAKARNC